MAKKKASGKRTPVAKAEPAKKKAVKGKRVTVKGVTREVGQRVKGVVEGTTKVGRKKAFVVSRQYEGPKAIKGQKKVASKIPGAGMTRLSMTTSNVVAQTEEKAKKKVGDNERKKRRRKDNSQAGQKTKATVRGGKSAKSAAKKGREVQRAVKKAVKKTSDNAKTRQRTPSSKRQATSTKKVARKAAKK